MSFKDLGLLPTLAGKCESLGYTMPTPVQKQAIPVVLTGVDLIACAETGTGKTAAFLLPIIQKLTQDKNAGTQVLVLAPTRELALQTEAACKDLAPKTIRCVALIGGASVKKQADLMRRGAEIVIATPGRLWDFMQRGEVEFSGLTTLVLDEADRMLDMGFLPQIQKIVGSLPKERQTLFFSATMSSEIERIALRMMKSPETVEVSRRGKPAETIKQYAYPVAAHSKIVLLLDLMEREKFERVLIFTRTKRDADRLSHILEAREHRVDKIHADRSQSQREAAIKNFKNGQTRILVATDIAARGLDIDLVSHVINYDVPEAAEDYVHRIGRTGRAGNAGSAITLVTARDEMAMRAIERVTKQTVERVVLPNFGGAAPSAARTAKPGLAIRSAVAQSSSFRPRGSR